MAMGRDIRQSTPAVAIRLPDRGVGALAPGSPGVGVAERVLDVPQQGGAEAQTCGGVGVGRAVRRRAGE